MVYNFIVPPRRWRIWVVELGLEYWVRENCKRDKKEIK
jgi:hypothetical protein